MGGDVGLGVGRGVGGDVGFTVGRGVGGEGSLGPVGDAGDAPVTNARSSTSS